MVMLVVVFLFGLFFKQISEFIFGGRLVEGLNKHQCSEDSDCGYEYCRPSGECDPWAPSDYCYCHKVLLEGVADWDGEEYNVCKGDGDELRTCVPKDSS